MSGLIFFYRMYVLVDRIETVFYNGTRWSYRLGADVVASNVPPMIVTVNKINMILSMTMATKRQSACN